MITLVKKLYAKAMLSDRVVWEARWRSTPFFQPQGGECAVYKGMAFELCLWPSGRALDMDFSSLRKQPFCPRSLARSEEKRLFTQARILEDATFV